MTTFTDFRIADQGTPRSRKTRVTARRSSRKTEASFIPVVSKSDRLAQTPNSTSEESAQSPNTVTFELSEPRPPAEPTYREWLDKEVLRSRPMTYFIAFYVHWIAMLCLGAVYLHMPEKFHPVSLDAIFTDSDITDPSLMEIVEAEFETDATEAAVQEVAVESELAAMEASTMVPTAEPSSAVPVTDAFASLVSDATAAATAAASKGKPAVTKRPFGGPAHAVTAGNFAVWTVPENPDPGDPYRIIIQIRLPDGTEKYSLTDLEGVVVGSDGYQKLIPGASSGFLPVEDGFVKFEVHVVSADKQVEDTVYVKSRMLREAQRLQIRF